MGPVTFARMKQVMRHFPKLKLDRIWTQEGHCDIKYIELSDFGLVCRRIRFIVENRIYELRYKKARRKYLYWFYCLRVRMLGRKLRHILINGVFVIFIYSMKFKTHV